jgi:hypothetical protein
MYDAHISYISRVKYFQMVESISSYLYVHHICFRCTTSMFEKPKFMKEWFSHDVHYNIMGWEVCDECPKHIKL